MEEIIEENNEEAEEKLKLHKGAFMGRRFPASHKPGFPLYLLCVASLRKEGYRFNPLRRRPKVRFYGIELRRTGTPRPAAN